MTYDVHSHSWYHQKHHDPSGGYYNVQGTTRSVSPVRAGRWLVHHYSSKKRKGNVPAPVVQTEPEHLNERPESVRTTWLGHASTLVQTPETNILLDPVFSDRCSPLSFAGPCREPALPLGVIDLPPIDLVLISHDHYDHLDKHTVQYLAEQHAPTFLVPLGLKKRLRKWDVQQVTEMDWWQYVDLKGFRIHCTPARHFSGRGILDRNSTLWCGWFVQPSDESPSIYYAGDTAYADHFSNMTLHLEPPDIAILPIGAYRPRWFMGLIHMSPQQAWQAFEDLNAHVMIPVHWGTFDLSKETLSEPMEVLRKHVPAVEHGVRMADLSIGESFTWQPQTA